jgi:DNA-binding transcriptional LysR family regulator
VELDIGAVRAFVAVAELHHFGAAADELGVSQQAVSKRVARLEDTLEARLFRREPTGANLTADGMALLPHGRAVLAAADQLVGAMRARRRALRVDVLGTRLSSVQLLRAFHDAASTPAGADVEIVTSIGLRSAAPALLAGDIDAAYARVTGACDVRLAHTLAYLEPLYVLVGRRHAFAERRSLTAAELDGTTAWMPGNAPGSEWAAFYADLTAAFGVIIETGGTLFGFDHLVDEIADDDSRLTFVGEGTPARMPWHSDVVRIPVIDPTPVYPLSLLWHRDSRHPLLPALIAHTRTHHRPPPGPLWMPDADRELLDPAVTMPRPAE